MGIQWGNIGNLLGVALAIGVMIIAIAMLARAKKGQLAQIAAASAGVIVIVMLFALAFTGQLIPAASTILSFLGFGGGKTPGFNPGLAP